MKYFTSEKVLFLVSFIDIFAVSLIVPLLNPHLKSKGYSNFKIGLVRSFYSCVQFVSSPVIGHWSDHFSRKSVLLLLLFFCSVSYSLLGISDSFLWILFFRGIIGSVKHTQLLCKTIIEDEMPESFQENYGKMSGSIALGFIVGPILGGYLVDVENGFTYICFAAGILFVVDTAITYFCIADTAEISSERRTRTTRSTSIVFGILNIPWSTCWDVFCIKMITTLVSASFLTNYNLTIRDRYEISPVTAGSTVSFQGLVGACTGFSIGVLNKLFSNLPCNFSKMLIGFFVFSAIFFVYFISKSFYVFIVLLIPLSMTSTFMRIVNNEILLENSTSENKGLLLGTFNNVTSIARVIVPLFTGLLTDVFGCDSVFMLCFLFSLTGVIVTEWRRKCHLKME